MLRLISNTQLVVSIVAMLGLSACVQPMMVPRVPEPPTTVFNSQTANPIAIEKVVTQVPRGQQVGVLMRGVACIPQHALNAGGGQTIISDAGYLQAITEQFKSSGYPVTTSPTELFTTKSADATRLRLAASVGDIKSSVCLPMSGFGDFTNGTGEGYVRVEWQVLDSRTRELVMRKTTEGYGAAPNSTVNPGVVVVDAAIAHATRSLLASPEFQSIARNPNLR